MSDDDRLAELRRKLYDGTITEDERFEFGQLDPEARAANEKERARRAAETPEERQQRLEADRNDWDWRQLRQLVEAKEAKAEMKAMIERKYLSRMSPEEIEAQRQRHPAFNDLLEYCVDPPGSDTAEYFRRLRRVVGDTSPETVVWLREHDAEFAAIWVAEFGPADDLAADPPPAAPKETRQERYRWAYDHADELELTPREREVAELVAAGRTSGQIARAFTISPRTVETHCENIDGKISAFRKSP